MKIKELTKGGVFTDGDWVESKDQDPQGSLRLIQLADIGDGYFIDKSKRFMNEETAKRLKCTFLEKDDILIARMPDPIGRCCLFPFDEPEKYVTVVDICILRFNGYAHKDYVKYALNSPMTRNKIESQVTGTTRQRITKKKIGELDIPLPPLSTQKKIAAVLDEADKLRQLNKQLIQKYAELIQSLFLDMFGDPVTNPKGWDKIPMQELMKIVRGGSPRPIDKFLGGSYPWIKIGDATKGDDVYLNGTKEHITKEGLTKTRLLPKDSLIFANCGVSLGFARIITFEGCIHDGWLAFSEIDKGKLNKIFILKALNSITRYFRETAPDGTQPNLNTSIMKSFKLIVPPVNLQNQFADSLIAIEAQKAKAQIALQKSDDLFNSLLQRAFKGELVAS